MGLQVTFTASVSLGKIWLPRMLRFLDYSRQSAVFPVLDFFPRHVALPNLNDVKYHWRDMWSCHEYHFCRDRSFLYVFVSTKHVFCCDKSMLAAAKLLLRQNYVCRDKTFVVTDTCLSQQAYECFVMTNRQNVCCDKSMFVATNTCHN